MAIRYCDWTNGQDCVVKTDRTTAISAWSSGTTYGLGDFAHDNVAYPNRKVYISLLAGNLNNALTDITWWALAADGSNTLPYQSITEASQGLTGGDEVRVAKSPANTALTGTLGFTAGSTAVTGSGTAFTTELAIGDFVQGADSQWYEIITITNDTAAVLYKKYPSSTTSGVSSYKLGVTDTGAAAASSTAIQTVSASGSSTSSRLKISGGWDLSGTPAQTDETWFRQMHGTFNNRYGYGLHASIKSYFELDKLNFLRYNYGLYISGGTYNKVISAICLSNQYGSVSSTSPYLEVVATICNSNDHTGMYITNLNYVRVGTVTANSNFQNGLYITNIQNGNYDTIVASYNTAYGIYIDSNSARNIFGICTVTANNYGVHFKSQANLTTIIDLTASSSNVNALRAEANVTGNIIYKFTGTGNIGLTQTNTIVSPYPILSIQDNNGDGSKNYFYGGETYSDTTDARSGTCLKYDPSSATAWMEHSFKMKVATGTAYTVGFYVKKDASFSGDIEAAIFNMGKEVVAYADKEPSTDSSYEQKTISIDTDDIIAAGIAELRIRVRGTAGNCFIDDISIT
jgi:hypothetical protein